MQVRVDIDQMNDTLASPHRAHSPLRRMVLTSPLTTSNESIHKSINSPLTTSNESIHKSINNSPLTGAQDGFGVADVHTKRGTPPESVCHFFAGERAPPAGNIACGGSRHRATAHEDRSARMGEKMYWMRQLGWVRSWSSVGAVLEYTHPPSYFSSSHVTGLPYLDRSIGVSPSLPWSETCVIHSTTLVYPQYYPCVSTVLPLPGARRV
jgi:hypothetical protein